MAKAPKKTNSRKRKPKVSAVPAAQATDKPRTRWTVNFRLLAITAGAVGVVLVALYFWGKFQVDRQSSALLTLAKEQVARGDSDDALVSYTRYVGMRPEDARAFAELIKLAAAQDDAVPGVIVPKCGEAISRLRNAGVNDKPLEDELHFIAAKALFRLAQFTRQPNRFKESMDHLRLMQKLSNDGHQLLVDNALKKREVEGSSKANEEELATILADAYHAVPDDPEICLEYARMLRNGRDPKNPGDSKERLASRAESTITTLTTDNPADPFAWHTGFLFHMDVENRPDARTCIDKAIEIIDDGDTDWIDREYVIWYSAGLFATLVNEVQNGLKYFEMAIDSAPTDISEIEAFDDRLALNESFTRLARMLYQDQRVDDAIKTLREAQAVLKNSAIQPELLLTEILTELGRLAEARETLDGLKQRYGTDANLTSFYRMQTRDLDAISSVLLRAEAKLNQKASQYYDAIRSWERYIVALGPAIDTAEIAGKKVDAHLHIADCYVVLQDFDAAGRHIERADEVLPENSRVATFQGLLAERQGKISAAHGYYAQALERKPIYYPAREGFARVVLSLARTTGEQPNWKLIEEQFPDDEVLPPVEREKWAMFRAQAAVTRKDYDQASSLLRVALSQNPKSTRVIQALAMNASLAGNAQQADAYAEQLKGVSESAYHVLQYEFHVRSNEIELAETELNKAIELASASEQRTLERVLAELELTRLGKAEQGRRRLASLAEGNSIADLTTYRRLVELAVADGAIEEAEEYLEHVRRLEGKEGVTVEYLEARIALRNGEVETAKRTLEVLRGKRVRWSPLKLLEALIAEEEDRMADAVLAYQDAVSFGERNPAIASRIYQLLGELERYADAEEFLAKISAESRQIGLAASIRNQQFGQAVTYAKADVDAEPSLRNWMRYGSALVFAGQYDEAEAAFLQALELNKTSPQALIQLVGCHITKYRNSGEEASLDQAHESLDRFMRDADAKPETLAFLAAQCHQLLGEMDEADTQYRRALRINGNKDITIIRTAAPFFASRDRKFAIELLEQAQDLDPEAGDITRLLAVLYSEAGTQDDWQRAYEVLMEESGSDATLDDRRLLALMKLRTGDPDSQYEARKLMEEVIAESVRKSPADEQLLAEIYEKTGDLEAALDKVRQLVNAESATVDSQQYYIQLLIKAKDFDEASIRLERMAENKSVPLGFLVRSKCEIAQAQGQANRIDSIVAAFINPELERHKDNRILQAQMMLAAADLTEIFGRDTATENWHKRRVQLVPASFTSYAVWLAEQKRVKEAVDLALEYAKPAEVGSMIGLLTTLTVAGAPEAEMARTRSVIQRGIQQCGEEVDFLIALATLRQIERKPREAVTLYERALHKSGRTSITALNNLALLLAETEGRGEEALKHIDQAINSRGTDNTALLDTKASVLIALERYDDALRIMQRIILRIDDNPVYYLHLAECQLQTGDREAAARSLQAAEENSIGASVLTALDSQMLTRLRTQLKSAEEVSSD